MLMSSGVVFSLQHASLEGFEEFWFMCAQSSDHVTRIVHNDIFIIYVDDHYCPVVVVARARDELVGSVANHVEMFKLWVIDDPAPYDAEE